MKPHAWVALGLMSLFAVLAPAAEAFEVNHVAISRKVISLVEKKYGPETANRLIVWNNLVEKYKDKPIAEKLAQTNDFFNRVPIKNETELWGHLHWSTPFEMLTRNVGSHADHAIGKYVTLEAMGVSIDQLQITHVHSAATPDSTYMVLTYHSKPDAMPLVLDTVKGEIKPANERPDLFPEDSINDSGLWLSNTQKDGRKDAQNEADTHIELWNEMNIRMDKEMLSIEGPPSLW